MRPFVPLSALLATVLLLGACSSDSEVSTAGEPNPSSTSRPGEATSTLDESAGDCAGPDWVTVTVDAGDFSFMLPPDVVEQDVQGIDSLVGEFVGGGLEVIYDYGWYSADLGELTRTGASATVVDIDGRAAEVVSADMRGTDYGDFVTALYVPLADSTGDAETKLSLWINYTDDTLTPIAECVTSTLRFA